MSEVPFQARPGTWAHSWRWPRHGVKQLLLATYQGFAAVELLLTSRFWNRAILDLKNQRDKLHQYQKRITVLTDRETAIARECLARGDKPRALLALRRKKYQETLLSKTDTQLIELEKLTSSVEFALVQKDVLFGLSQGTEVLKAIHKEMGGLEGVEKMMGENEEARAYQEVWLACYPFL